MVGGSLSLRNSTLQSMALFGIEASSGTSVVVRNTALSNCQIGVYLEGPSGSADLGTASSAGGNTITSNSQYGVRVGFSGGQTVYAVGNSWIASFQRANATGQYGSTLITGPVNSGTGVNYYVDSNGGKIQF